MDTLGPGEMSCIERCPHLQQLFRLEGVVIYMYFRDVLLKRGSTVIINRVEKISHP